jgi:uncharacterized protein YuzE
MAEAIKVTKRELLKAAASLLKLPSSRIWADYDEEADVLYLSFRKPQDAKDSIMKDDIIYHYDGEELVGVTLLHAQERLSASPSKG